MSPFDKLQSLQRTKTEFLLQCQECEIEIYTSFVGIFWRNPLISSDVLLMARIILNLSYESWPLLLPHLGEWVLANSCRLSRQGLRDSFFETQLHGEPGWMYKWVAIQPGSYNVPFIHVPHKGMPLDDHAIRSASGLYKGSAHMRWRDLARGEASDKENGPVTDEYTLRQTKMNEELVANFALLRDVDNSGPDSWWVFSELRGMWFMVDYVGKRMWGSENMPVMCYWGDDVWDPTSWKLGSEGSKFGEEWFAMPVRDIDRHLGHLDLLGSGST
jgi:hypothetical protein